jgi:hypothetical protein
MKLAERYLLACYYRIKPLIPRWLQIKARSWLVLRKSRKYTSVWPIDTRAAARPPNWQGWPNGNRFALVLTHDVDTARGRDRCDRLASLEEKLGFRSSFNFVCEDYPIPAEIRNNLAERGFEVGVHGIRHNGNPFRSRRIFSEQAAQINRYLELWGAVGFRCPCMYHNLDWIGELDIEYDSSTFDTDPFEPQPDGMKTVFPFLVSGNSRRKRYVELPYTLPQDFTLFILMRLTNIDIWKRKLDWIAQSGGMALINCHPDYMNWDRRECTSEEYPAGYYEEFLKYVMNAYKDEYWHALPRVMAQFVCESYGVAEEKLA